MFKKFSEFSLRNRIGRSFIKFGSWIVGSPMDLLEIHDCMPSESPFTKLSTVLCSETDEEARCRAEVRERVGDEKLAKAFAFYSKDFPKGSIYDFNQLDAATRRSYFEKSSKEIDKYNGIIVSIENGEKVTKCFNEEGMLVKEIRQPTREALTPIRACDVPE